jgi:hypothetical protein
MYLDPNCHIYLYDGRYCFPPIEVYQYLVENSYSRKMKQTPNPDGVGNWSDCDDRGAVLWGAAREKAYRKRKKLQKKWELPVPPALLLAQKGHFHGLCFVGDQGEPFFIEPYYLAFRTPEQLDWTHKIREIIG